MRAAAARLAHWRASRPAGVPWPAGVVEYRWLLEELRVSLFAQQLGTVRSVSAKRLEQAWRKALDERVTPTARHRLRVSGVELLNMSRVMRHSPFGWR